MGKTLEKLQKYLQEMNRVEHVVSLLSWDMYTTMPKGGFEKSADTTAYFSSRYFEMATSEELGNLLEKLMEPEEFEALEDMWKFIVKRMKQDFEKDRRIPADVFENWVKARSQAQYYWEEAKKQNDFSIFAPKLETLICLTKEKTGYTDPGKDVYDALLNQYEEGIQSQSIDQIFKELKDELVPLIERVTAGQGPQNPKFQGKFDVDAQAKVQKLLLDYIGFSWEQGAVGTTEHPFTMNFSSKDVRITNHYYEEYPVRAMFSAIHEGGHAIFEQNVNPKYDNTAAGNCRYSGLHESQSRFYENILGRNINFWIPIYDKLGEILPQFKEISLEEFYKEINRVQNSFIRTEADELTYGLHIILRYEIEKAIFRDHVKAEDLPALWNAKMQEYFHITPTGDAEGILQDMHWSSGMFGYFPSYLLGNIYDGMFKEKMEEELGDIDTILAQGRIMEITKWLNEKIHQYGSTRLPKETLLAVCKKEVTAQPLIRYFKEKYPLK